MSILSQITDNLLKSFWGSVPTCINTLISPVASIREAIIFPYSNSSPKRRVLPSPIQASSFAHSTTERPISFLGLNRLSCLRDLHLLVWRVGLAAFRSWRFRRFSIIVQRQYENDEQGSHGPVSRARIRRNTGA